MSMPHTENAAESFQDSNDKSKQAVSSGNSTANKIVGAVKDVKAGNAPSILNGITKLQEFFKNPLAFVGNINSVVYALPVAIVIFLMFFFVVLSLPAALTQEELDHKEATMAYSINYQETANPDSLVLDFIDSAVSEEYDSAIDDVKRYMIDDSQQYGCVVNDQVELIDEVGYETSNCKVILIMGPKESDKDNRSSYTKEGFKQLIISRMEAVNAVIDKFGKEVVEEGRAPTMEESVAFAQENLYVKEADPEPLGKGKKSSGDIDNIHDKAKGISEAVKNKEKSSEKETDHAETTDTTNVEGASEFSNPKIIGLLQPPYVSDTEPPEESNPGDETTEEPVDTETTEDAETGADKETEEASAKPEEKSDDEFDTSRMGDETYLPEILKKHGTQYTNLYSEAALSYLDEFRKNDDHKIIWAASSYEWESEATDTDTEIQQGKCQAYVQTGSSSFSWQDTDVGCSATKTQQNIRPYYSNASYYELSGDNIDPGQITSKEYLYWNDTNDFFKEYGTLNADFTAADGTVIPAGSPLNSHGIAFTKVMEEYGITEDDIFPNGSLKCYRGDDLITFNFPADSKLYSSGGSTPNINCTELNRPTFTAYKKIATFYVPFYYDLFDYHSEEIENIKKAIQFKDPDDIKDQDEVSEYVNQMIDDMQRSYAQQYGFEDMLDTIEMKRYERPFLGTGVAEMLFDGETRYMSGDGNSEITWHNIQEEITSLGASYFGRQCTDFAKWRFLQYYGWVYLSNGNGNEVAHNLVAAYPDKFELITDTRNVPAGSIFSLKTYPWGHVGFVEKVEDGYIYFSDGNVNMSTLNIPDGMRINEKMSIEAWEAQGPHEYACPKPEYIDELKGKANDDSGSSSSSNYEVRINAGTNVVTVYNNGKPYRAFRCSVNDGKGNNFIPTPAGSGILTHNRVNNGDWYKLMSNEDGTENYSRWCSRMEGDYPYSGYLIHCVTNTTPSTGSLRVNEYNKLGTYASHGCVRLQADYARWIFEHCEGSKFTVFWGTSSDDPMRPAAVSRINVPSQNERYGWDPTDPSPGNPWR